MRFDRLVEARFIRRLNRFAALVDLDRVETLVHVANSGRMKELLVEERRVLLKPAAGDHRKTAFDLALVDLGHTLASADARLPNILVHEALKEGRLPQFAFYDQFLTEVTYGESRLDLALQGQGRMCFIETKSVTLVTDGTGLFPDAPTSRGRKHMGSLLRAVGEGYRAAVLFVVQRDDVREFAPNYEADPEFGQALRLAVEGGVEVYAYRCRVTTRLALSQVEGEVVLAGQLPVRL